MTKWTESSFILQPSPIGGIGLFATHDIPANTQVLCIRPTFRKMKTKDVPTAFQKFCIHLNDEEALCPERFDRMEAGWFINHSFEPNIEKRSDTFIVAIRDIKAGDEILIDYNHLQEPEHLKEPYYKTSER